MRRLHDESLRKARERNRRRVGRAEQQLRREILTEQALRIVTHRQLVRRLREIRSPVEELPILNLLAERVRSDEIRPSAVRPVVASCNARREQRRAREAQHSPERRSATGHRTASALTANRTYPSTAASSSARATRSCVVCAT